MLWPLITTQKVSHKKTNHQKTPRDGVLQERMRRNHDRGVWEARFWRHDPNRDRQGLVRMLRPAGGGGGGWFEKMAEKGRNL